MGLADRKALEFAGRAERVSKDRREQAKVGSAVMADRVLALAGRVEALRCTDKVRQDALVRIWRAFAEVSAQDDRASLESREVHLGDAADVLAEVHGSDSVYFA